MIDTLLNVIALNDVSLGLVVFIRKGGTENVKTVGEKEVWQT